MKKNMKEVGLNCKNEFLDFFPKNSGGLKENLQEYFIKNPSDWFKFKKEFSKIMRWGDLREEIKPKESDFEHVLEMYQISRELREKFPDEFKNIDIDKFLVMIGLHDIGELNKDGDVPATEKHENIGLNKDIERREKITSYKVLKGIKDKELRFKLTKILAEYEQRQSKEAKLVKMIDIVQASRKYSNKVLPKLKSQDLAQARKNVKEVQINNFLNKGINNIAADFPAISDYLKEDFYSILDKTLEKIPDFECQVKKFKTNVEKIITA